MGIPLLRSANTDDTVLERAANTTAITAPVPGPIATPQGVIQPQSSTSLWQRAKAAVQAFQAPIFSPMTPMAPMQDSQEFGPRAWEYRPGYNVSVMPRMSEGLTPFSWMINVAELYDILNATILFRQEEIASLDWQIVPRNRDKPPSQAQMSEAHDRFERPDGKRRTGQWLTAAIWDVLVTDALSIFVNRTKGGDILSWDLVDGATVRPLIDGSGVVPDPPVPAYQQVLYGRPFWEGTTADLLYLPKNPRARSAYGRSPVEMLIMTINRALRRQSYDINYYAEGNIPEAIVTAPMEWNQDQIRNMQEWFDTVVSDPRNRRKLHFIPSQRGTLGVHEFRPPIVDTKVEEFLDQRVMMMFGIPPQMLGLTQNANKANSGTQENASQARLLPYLRYLSGVITDLFVISGLPDCVLEFAGERPDEDKLAQAQIDDIYLRNGVQSIDDVRSRIGLQTEGQHYLYLASGAVPFPPTPQMLAALTPQAAPTPDNPTATPTKGIGPTSSVTDSNQAKDISTPMSGPGGKVAELATPAPKGATNTQSQASSAREAQSVRRMIDNDSRVGPSYSLQSRASDTTGPDQAIREQLQELKRWQRFCSRGITRRAFQPEVLSETLSTEIQQLLTELPTDQHSLIFREAAYLVRAASPSALISWYEDGADGQIDWGSDGDFDQCVGVASNYMDEDLAQGFCELRHQAATGMSTSEHSH